MYSLYCLRFSVFYLTSESSKLELGQPFPRSATVSVTRRSPNSFRKLAMFPFPSGPEEKQCCILIMICVARLKITRVYKEKRRRGTPTTTQLGARRSLIPLTSSLKRICFPLRQHLRPQNTNKALCQYSKKFCKQIKYLLIPLIFQGTRYGK